MKAETWRGCWGGSITVYVCVKLEPWGLRIDWQLLKCEVQKLRALHVLYVVYPLLNEMVYPTQGVTKKCRLIGLANSALVYDYDR
jgi:hypothetical protein